MNIFFNEKFIELIVFWIFQILSKDFIIIHQQVFKLNKMIMWQSDHLRLDMSIIYTCERRSRYAENDK